MIVVKWWQKFFFSLSSWFVNILQTNVQTAVPQLLEKRAKTRKDSSAQMFYSNLLDLSQSYLIIWSSHCKLCCTCGLLAVQCNQAVIYILSPVMIALKNVLCWICSLMHGKLLLALMGAVCAGEGERHLPPAFKSRLIVFCLCLALCVGCQKQRTTENFVVVFFSFFISCCLFCHFFDHFWSFGPGELQDGAAVSEAGCSVSCHAFKSLPISCPWARQPP